MAVLRAALLAATATTSYALSISAALGGAQLTPLVNGRAVGAPVPLSSLYEERGSRCVPRGAAGAALADVNVPVFAVVKEEELPEPVEQEKMRGLVEFQNDYFGGGPMYLSDEARTLYEYLGSQPIFTLGTLGKALLNPLKARREMKEMGERMKAKSVEGNMVGDGLVKGGILCIAPSGELKYTFYEDPGKGVPPECQAKIAEAARAFGSTKVA